LKVVKPTGENNEPAELYTRFMSLSDGAKALGPEIKRVYAPLFQASHAPYQESNETLQNLFNIHSGGGERSLEYQIQTFKALCENAMFDQAPPASGTNTGGPASDVLLSPGASIGSSTPPTVNINLHIHLPENKTRRDYEDIIEDIGRYIFGRNSEGRRE
jgi:hypothetical protein